MNPKLRTATFVIAALFIFPIAALCGLSIWRFFLGGPPKEMSADTMLSLLGFLTIVATALAYVFQEVVHRDLKREVEQRLLEIKQLSDSLKQEVQTLAEDERTASTAEGHYVAALVFWLHHYGVRKDPKLVAQAIKQARLSIERIKSLRDGKKYRDLILKCKNNLAFFLSAQEEGAEKPGDKDQAFDLSAEIFDIVTGTNGESLPVLYRHALRATRALVLWRFFGTEERYRRKAYEILKAIHEDDRLPQPTANDLTEQWQFLFGKPPATALEEMKPTIRQ